MRATATTARAKRIVMFRVFFVVKSVALVIVKAMAPAATTVTMSTVLLTMASEAVPPPKKPALDAPKLPITPLMTFTTRGMAAGTACPSPSPLCGVERARASISASDLDPRGVVDQVGRVDALDEAGRPLVLGKELEDREGGDVRPGGYLGHLP